MQRSAVPEQSKWEKRARGVRNIRSSGIQESARARRSNEEEQAREGGKTGRRVEGSGESQNSNTRGAFITLTGELLALQSAACTPSRRQARGGYLLNNASVNECAGLPCRCGRLEWVEVWVLMLMKEQE